MHEALTRQLDIIPLHVLDVPVTVIGAGAIGSHTVKALAQMGMTDITAWDDDAVDVVNLNAQGYPRSALKKPKVEALREIVAEYTGTQIKPVKDRYTAGTFKGIVISAVDNMETRKLIWQNHARKGFNTMAIIDPRMGAENAFLMVAKPLLPEDIATYEKALFEGREEVREPCTAKATIYTAMLLSGLVCKAVKDLLVSQANYTRLVLWNIRENDCTMYHPKGAVTHVAV